MKNLTEEYLNECRQALISEQAHSLSTTNNWEHVNREQVHQDWNILPRK